METWGATPNLDTATAVSPLVPTSFAWKLQYLVVVHHWAREAGAPLWSGTKHQQDPADYYPSCVNKHLSVQGRGKYWENFRPMYLMTHTSYAPHKRCVVGTKSINPSSWEDQGTVSYTQKHKKQLKSCVQVWGIVTRSCTLPPMLLWKHLKSNRMNIAASGINKRKASGIAIPGLKN